MTTFTALTHVQGRQAAETLAEACEDLEPEPVGTGVFEIEDGSDRWEVGIYFTESPDEIALALLAGPLAALQLPEGATRVLEEREALRTAVPAEGLRAAVPGGGTLHELAREVVAIARAGLSARARLNASGDNETGFLDTLDEIVASGKVPAQRLLDKFHGEWNGDVSRVYKYSF